MRVWTASMLLVAILSVLPTSNLRAGEEEKKTIAILYFENNSIAQKEELAPLSKGLADMLITEMSKIEALKVIERAQLQQLLDEMKLGMTGNIDEKTAQQVGKLLGAQTLLLGGFVNMFGGNLRIDARMVEVETGLTLKAEEETGKVDKLFEMVKKLTQKIAKDLEVKLTKEDKARLAVTENENFEASLYYSKGLDLQDAGKYAEAVQMYQKALAANPKFSQAQNRLEEIKQKLETEKPKE